MGTNLSVNRERKTEELKVRVPDGDEDDVPLRRNLFFPNEILEKILSFLSVRDKLIAREVCSDWMLHVNYAGDLQNSVNLKIQSDEVITALTATEPVFTRFHFHKIDLTRQSINFWTLYSEHITHLNFYDCSVIPRRTSDCENPDFFLGCPNLKHLGLVNCDKYFLMGGMFIQLHEILHLENLETLDLSRNKNLTDNILFSILDKTTKLKGLDLSDCVNMVFMKAVHSRFYPFRNFSEMESDRLRKYSDNVLSFHTLCDNFLLTEKGKHMQEFNFGMKLNSTGINILTSNDRIAWKTVNLESPELKAADLKQFFEKFHSSLISVKLGRCKLNSSELFSADLHSLQEFSLHDSRHITDLLFLKTMPNLQKLVLDGITGFEFDSSAFAGLRRLTELSLNGIKPLPRSDGEPITLSLIECFKYTPNLISLDIGNCGFVNDDVIQEIIVKLKHMRMLNIESTSVTDAGLAGISKQEYLRRKEMSSAPVGESSGSGTIEIETESHSLAELADLEYLNLSYCCDIGDATWLNAIKFKSLSTLNLSSCSTLSKNGLLSIIDSCRNLQKLILLHCSIQIITDVNVVGAFREKLYRCKEITY